MGIILLIVIATPIASYLYSRDNRILLENKLLKTQNETREQVQKELSEEIHDNVGQLLSSAKLLLGVTERNLQDIPPTLITAQETLGKAIKELRALTKSLNVEWLNQFSLLENLRIEIQRINGAGIVSIKLQEVQAALPLESSKQLILFRIMQEAIHNIVKHSNATQVEIYFSFKKNDIKICVKDNGSPFNTTKNGGLGILTMNNRAKLLKGSLCWGNERTGNELVIYIPSSTSYA